jgi:hypothetical protein
MSENPQVEQQTDNLDTTPAVNEQGGFIFSTAIKITDPNTKEVILHMRGDD